MKKLSSFFLFSVLPFSVLANDEGLGIGLIAGSPTGLSMKYWIGKNVAIDAAAEWSTSGNDRFYFHADYLLHDYSLIKQTELKVKLPVYYGIGAFITLKEDVPGKGNDDDILALRVPFGISCQFTNSRFEAFAEIVPALELSPDTDLNIDAAVGARFYF